MTSINCLSSSVNYVHRHTIFITYKILRIFDNHSIIYVYCFEGDKQMIEKSQITLAKIALGCFKTTSSNDVLTDFDLANAF